ncbi:MAG: hypothetical protein HYV09_38295 [Deltaproteobacteria bacterium]|nr:hypothetical protein [Deltaproteobacteria bacterium]
MTKKTLTAMFALAAFAIPTAAFGQAAEKEPKGGKVETKGSQMTVTTPEITTTPGNRDESMAITDVDELSRKSRRDFVRNPVGLSGAAALGFGLGDAYGTGFGLRAGYTMPGRVYLGGIANYHIGNTAEALGSNITNRSWYFGPEAGYDLGLGKVILRPVIGVGLAFRTKRVEAPGVATSDVDTRPYVAPGASLMYPIGNFFVGADSRAVLATGEGNSTLTFLGTAGAHL